MTRKEAQTKGKKETLAYKEEINQNTSPSSVINHDNH
jgi:hypothetical protein